jgi:type IV pilus assembly protein PilP
MRASQTIKPGLTLSLLVLGLSGCGGGSDDLDAYVNEVKKRKGGVIEPLPEITPYEVFDYLADKQGIRSPFQPDLPQSAGSNSGPRPDDERSREYLETFPLDALSMVGTLHIDDTMFGLVRTSDGLIHRVTSGNFMGQNDGRIMEISESEIDLVEIISDGIGGYIERDAAVGLTD